jgi:hypothetical protein
LEYSLTVSFTFAFSPNVQSPVCYGSGA